MESYGQLIERTVYTASLATRAEEVDPLLDPLREITTRIVDKAQPVIPTDSETLHGVQRQLEQYLLTQEKIRLFTPDSLHLQIDLHMQGNNYLRKSRLQLGIVLSTAFVVALSLALLLPLQTPEQRGLVGGATVFSLVTVGAATLFLTALRAFQSELRRAFLVICAAVTLLGLSLLGQPIMEIFHLRHFPATSILYTTPILIAAVLFHIGDAMYARLMGVKNWWTTPAPVLIGMAVMALCSWLAPHPATTESELIHDIVAVMWGIMLVTPICSAIVLRMTIPRASELYKPSIRLLLQSMLPIILVVSYQYVLRIVAGPFMEGIVAYVLFGFVTLMGLSLTRAAYTFNKVSRY